MMSELDKNKDGEISFDEYCDLYTSKDLTETELCEILDFKIQNELGM